jgi:monoamine oxidase
MHDLGCPIPQNYGPEQGKNGLKAGIIGAGIAGLSAAIALSRSGHHVEVR